MAVTITGKPSSLHCGPNLQIILKCKRHHKKKLKGKKLKMVKNSYLIGKIQLKNIKGTLFALNFAIFPRQYFAKLYFCNFDGGNDKRSLNFAKALSTSLYFQKKKSLNYNLSKQTGTS